MKFPRTFVVVCLFALACGQAFSQAPVASSPQALNLAGQALQSLAGGTALADVRLQASAAYSSGSTQEAGTATLIARGNTQSLQTMSFTDGTGWQQVRNGYQGATVSASGTATAMATHNCFIDANWFFPALSLQSLATDPTLVAGLVGQQVYEGQQVYHLTFLHNLPGQTPGMETLIQTVSAMDLYLDAGTRRPVILDFTSHPDYDAYTNIPMEIRFGAYQSFNGVWAPTRIQTYRNNMLILDLTVTNALVNSGVAGSTFALPAISAGGAQ